MNNIWKTFQNAEQTAGANGVEKAYNELFSEHKDDYVLMTEISIALNYRGWMHYNMGCNELAATYFGLYYKHDEWCWENLHGNQIEYYFQVTD